MINEEKPWEPLLRRVFALYDARNTRVRQRWVLNRGHIDAFHAMVEENNRANRERLTELAGQIEGFDPNEHMKAYTTVAPDYGDGNQLHGLPIRVADVDEIYLEPFDLAVGMTLNGDKP